MSEAFQRIEVADVFTPGRKAVFSRPIETNDTIVVVVPPGGDFHLDAGTLRVIAEVLASSPSPKIIV